MDRNKLHLTTIAELRNKGHYLVKLLLAEQSCLVSVHTVEGILMVECPDGMLAEVHPHELESIKAKHYIVWR